MSRADLARSTGLSSPTVGKLADALIEDGLIEEQGHAESGSEAPAIGRPSRPLRLASDRPRFVAVQLGVRHTRLAALPVAGPTGDDWPVRYTTPDDPGQWQARLKKAAVRLPDIKPLAVLISVPGVTDEQRCRTLFSPNLHWTEGADFVEAAQSIWDSPVLLVQEIRALALGHYRYEPGATDFLLVDFGLGVGGALMRNGELYSGAVPLTGELGHTRVLGNDRVCGCGSAGCVETLVSRDGLLASFKEHTGQPGSWASLVGHIKQNGIPDWLTKSLDEVATVIAGAINVAGVTRVVITGSLTELPEVVVEHLRGGIVRSSMWARFGSVDVVPAPRRRAAGLVSAAIDRLLLPKQGVGSR